MNIRIAITLTVALFTGTAASAAIELVTNGTFDSGTSDWTTTLTPNTSTTEPGANDALSATQVFETESGVQSNAAAFRVGNTSNVLGLPGGVIFDQSIEVSVLSNLSFNADIAFNFDNCASVEGPCSNSDSGTVAASFGTWNLGQVAPGSITNSETLRGNISEQILNVAPGSYLLSFLITRKATPGATTPYQFIDNVSVLASPVPLPAALPLLLGGVAALGALSRRRRHEAA
jgi:hypothetical protein